MADSRVLTGPTGALQAGIITKVRLENFMCHSHMEIDLGDRVNFITGQNGSGKSAILTALCIAFGCRAKSTDRATTLKEFIKTGCSYALVHLEIKNQGEDAFKPDTYGDVITLERRITESSSTSVLKDHQGKKVASRREDIRELVEHFNIDVENPCVVMSQDKSREFLHSGNDKDKFKFFFKATLLSQVDDLLKSIKDNLDKANGEVVELERSIAPVEKELNELQGKIKSMEHIEEISQQVQLLTKKCAWSLVYDIDKQIQEETARIRKLEERIPQCQARIDQQIAKVAELQDCLDKKKAQSAIMMESTSNARKRKNELEQKLSLATKERIELEQEHSRRGNSIIKMVNRMKLLEQQISDVNEQHVKDTQAEEFEMEKKLKELQDEVNVAESNFQRLKNIEDDLSESLGIANEELRKIASEIDDYEKKINESKRRIRELRLNQTNKVTAFGGYKVSNLLQAIERNHHRFKRPPIGPIGAHVALIHGDKWAVAVENAIGKLLNAFIVTDHKDSLLLRSCAREANYHHLQIIIYDFSIPRLQIPNHMLPQTNHPTTISVIQSDSPTVVNVLVDMGGAERQVLVRDYDMGTMVAFDQRISNLKEVYTLEGHRMFSRGSAQTILPPNKNARTGRLCSSYDDQIKTFEREALQMQEQAQQARGKKRSFEERLQNLKDELNNAKRQRVGADKFLMSKKLGLQDLKNSYTAEAITSSASSVDELHLEVSKVQNDKSECEILLKKIQERWEEAKKKADKLKVSFEELCESAKADINALDEATRELTQIEEDLRSAEAEKSHYEGLMEQKVRKGIELAKQQFHELENERKMESGDDVVEVSGTSNKFDTWHMKNTICFIDLMEEEVKKGNRVTTTFTAQSWSFILTKLIEKTGHVYIHDQLKNKYNFLRQEYRCCKTLCEQSGMTRDPVTNMFYASEELWERLFKVNKFAKKFKEKGCLYYDKLCTIFGDTTAIGTHSHPSTKLPSDSEDEDVKVQETQEANISKNERKRSRRGKRGDSLNNSLSTFLEGLGAQAKKRTESVEKLVSVFSGDFGITGGVGVGESFGEMENIKLALDCLGKLDVEGHAYGKAFNKIREDPIWREMFVSISDERKVHVVMSLI